VLGPNKLHVQVLFRYTAGKLACSELPVGTEYILSTLHSRSSGLFLCYGRE